MNDPEDFRTSLSRSDSEGHGSVIFCISRGFCSYILEKRDRKNVRMSPAALKFSRAKQCVIESAGETENCWRICSSTRLVKRKRRGSRCFAIACVTISMKFAIISLSSHSSRASMTKTVGRVGMTVDRIGSMINFWNWCSSDRWKIWWSLRRARSIYDLVAGTETARLYASVDMKWVMELRRPAPLKKKKLPASLSLPAQSSAIVLDIADFPDPAAPYSQQIGWSLSPSIHAMIFPMTSWRVPSIHLETDPMLSYIASGTGCNAATNGSEFRYQNTFSLEQGRNDIASHQRC